MASLCLPLGPFFNLTRSRSSSAASGLATSWAGHTSSAAITTKGSHFPIHSRRYAIAVSNYTKSSAKAIQIQPVPGMTDAVSGD